MLSPCKGVVVEHRTLRYIMMCEDQVECEVINPMCISFWPWN
jgi:hypothetical protein